jgi:hypothetical protein
VLDSFINPDLLAVPLSWVSRGREPGHSSTGPASSFGRRSDVAIPDLPRPSHIVLPAFRRKFLKEVSTAQGLYKGFLSRNRQVSLVHQCWGGLCDQDRLTPQYLTDLKSSRRFVERNALAMLHSRDELDSLLKQAFAEGVNWPLDRPSLGGLLHMGLTIAQLARYFSIDPAEVQLLLNHNR